MIPCVSVDGIDGSGKTTLIKRLSEVYNVVTLPRFYSMGMVPVDSSERKHWFLTNDALTTTKIYISGHKSRIFCAKDFKKGLHYKFIGSKNNLVLIDRGLWSLKAFSFAAIMKGTNFSESQSDEKVDEFIDKDLRALFEETAELSILLFDVSEGVLEKILSRRTYDKNDELLIRYQYDYYLRHAKDADALAKTLVISPIKSPEEIFAVAVSAIERLKTCTETATTY